MVLGTFTLIISLVLSISTGCVSYNHWAGNVDTEQLAVFSSIFLGVMVFILAIAILGYVSFLVGVVFPLWFYINVGWLVRKVV